MPDKLTPAELAAENERLKLACQAYRKFIQAEMHLEGYRGEFYGQKASEQNCLKLEAWLKEHGLYTAGEDLVAELAALRAQAEWRPIAELPEGRNRILACDADRDVFTAYRSLGGTWFDDGSFVREPTHWQPLPPPPAESRDQ